MPDLPYGTHQQRQRPREGWPNVKAPEVHPGRKIRKARERLAARIKDWESRGGRNNESKHKHHKPGSLKCK